MTRQDWRRTEKLFRDWQAAERAKLLDPKGVKDRITKGVEKRHPLEPGPCRKARL